MVDALRLQAMGAPDVLFRADDDRYCLGHHRAGSMNRLGGLITRRQGDHVLFHLRTQGRVPRGSGLGAQ